MTKPIISESAIGVLIGSCEIEMFEVAALKFDDYEF